MKKNKLILIFFSFIIIFSFCRKENKYPIIFTGEVTDIDSTGVIFHGKITSLGTQEIVDYGFIWNPKGELTSIDSYKKSLGIPVKEQTYSAKIHSSFIEGQEYNVRSYIITRNSIYYGNIVPFISLGSRAPRITDFEPKQATWGDIITITGENFSMKEGENLVKFGMCQAEITEFSETKIETIVPTKLDTTPVDVSVSFVGNKGTAKNKFTLIPPMISEFSPQYGTWSDEVTIKGKYFHPDYTVVKFDTLQANIKSITKNEIVVTIPNGLIGGECDLKVIVAGQMVISDIKFTSLSHKITGFSPITASFGNEITILGNNFSSTISENIVKFGNVVAAVTEANLVQLKVTVPNGLLIQKSKISVTINAQTEQADNEFTLLHPVINSFSPMSGTFREEITISGENFNPILLNNRVKFGNINSIVSFASNTQLKIKVPENYFSVTGKTKISIDIGELSVISVDEFDLHLHSINSLSQGLCNRGDTITIGGSLFNPAAIYNHVYFDNHRANVINSSASQIVAIIPYDFVLNTNPELKIEIAGREVISSVLFTIQEPWSQLLDFPGNRKQAAVNFEINGKGYFGGGYYDNDFWEYDPILNSWTQRKNCPVLGSINACFSTDTKGYFLYKSQLWQYDPNTDSWSRKSDFPNLTEYGRFAFSIDNKAYVGGGNLSPFRFYEYDENTNVWTRKADFPISITSGVGFSIGTKGYVVFGRHGNRDLWEYNVTNDSWSKKLGLSNIVDAFEIDNSRYFSIGFSINGKGYFGTGSSFYPNKDHKDFYEFDPISNTCKKISGLFSNRVSASAISINNKGYVCLGQDGDFNFYYDFWEFDPAKLKP